MCSAPTQANGRVVIVGAGIAGLLCARAFSDFFTEVVLLDRDLPPQQPLVRRGAPQSSHFHGLLPGGFDAITQLFPEFEQDLEAAGAKRVGPRDFRYFSGDGVSYAQGLSLPEPSPHWRGSGTSVQTRGLLEHVLRRRVHLVANVKPRYECAVRELFVENGTIRGVLIEQSGEAIEADLVIDATGRAGATQRWLQALGFALPRESVVNCALGYTSMLVEPADPSELAGLGIFLAPDLKSRHRTRGGVLVQVEGGRWLASIMGWAADYPPTALDAFMDFAKTLSTPIFHDLLHRARPLSEPVSFRFPKSVRRHFEELERFPERLLPVGDALCFFNPVYGQGMSVAARQVSGLRTIVARRRAEGICGMVDSASEFFRLANEEIRGPWLYAAISDFMGGCGGDFPSEDSANLEALQKLILKAAEGDVSAMSELSELQSLRKPLGSIALRCVEWRAAARRPSGEGQ